jgi:Bacterial regulatory protein, arsR family
MEAVVSDLVRLAADFVRLTGELEATRASMRKLLLNGEGGKSAAPFLRPTRPASGGSRHPNAKAAQAAEDRILELLKGGPKRLSEIAEATEAKQSTLSERMRRLRQLGQVAPAGGGAWAASA